MADMFTDEQEQQDEYDSDSLLQRIVEQQQAKNVEPIEPIEPVDDKPFRNDLARYIQNTVGSVGDTALDIGEYFGADVTDERKTVDNFAYQMGASMGGLFGADAKALTTPEGERSEYSTPLGLGLEIGSVVTGGAAGARKLTSLAPRLPGLIRNILPGSLAGGVILGDEPNISEILLEIDASQTKEGEEGFVGEDTLSRDILEFFATNKENTAAENRLKVVLEDATIGISVAVLLGVPVAIRYAKQLFNSRPSELSSEESAEVLMQYMRDAKETTDYKNSTTNQVTYTETPKDIAQIEQQNKSGINRFLRQMFTTRGYWTTNANNAFYDSQYAQRQIVAKSENIANRLHISLRSLGDETATKEMSERVQSALEADLGFHPQVVQEARVDFVMRNYDVTEPVAKEILKARELIDDMSGQLANSSIPNEEFKEIIRGNAGEYIRRSYRLFEDSGYKPSEDIRQNAVDYLTNNYLRGNSSLSFEEATEKALGKVDEILREGEDATDVMDYYEKVRKVNTEILQGRKDISEPIRQLMGEITEPGENIVLTISKLAKLNETNRYFETLNDMAGGRYIFNDATERNGVAFAEKISGTNSVLDGKYTTPEIITALKNRESLMIDGNTGLLNGVIRNFATLKGTSQAAKTIYSHVTHLRNILGGAQFGVANGVNPFANGGKALSTIKNRIAREGNEAYDALYEEYLRLGIINTNIRVNEFRALLETGYESTADTLITNIAQKLPGYGLGKKATEGVQDFYMAVDDFYKVANFERELTTLQKAFPDEALPVLKERAAKIVQDTLPNYDRVPKGIKATRFLPVGNFVAFPTEMWRTSVNIIRQGAAELSSGNPELVKRGAQRMAGFATVSSGWGLMSSYTADMAGFTEEENQAIQYLSQTPWSKAPKNVYRDEEGQIFLNDTQFIDSYSVIKGPLLEVIDRINNGELKGDDLDKVLAESVFNATKVALAPYVEESMLTKAISDVTTAYFSGDGRTSEGKLIFDVRKPSLDNAIEAASIIMDSFVPGTVTSLNSLSDAYNQEIDKNGQPKSFEAELVTNLTGVKFTKFNPQEALMYAIKNYNYSKRNISYTTVAKNDEPMDVADMYFARQKELYKLQQDLHLKVNAATTLIKDEAEVVSILLDEGFSKKDAALILNGTFLPEAQSTEFFTNLNELPVDPELISAAQDRIIKMRAAIAGTDLIPVNDSSEYMAKFKELEEAFAAEDKEREEFAKGGEVDIPQAPAEPDERIDKMTGLPYNQQAGAAFMDAEDPERRLEMAEGGLVYPENKKFLEDFHNDVIKNKKEMVEDGMTTTMRIMGLNVKGKEYLLPSYDPDNKRIMSSKETAEKFLDLIERGVIKGYDSVEEAEQDRKKMYKDIVERDKKMCGGEMKRKPKRKRLRKFEGGLASLLGINEEDVKWAKDLGKKFGEEEELDGRGDAARHLALGWLASKTDYPSLAKFAADAREVVGLDFKGADMDWKNNELGYNLPANSRKEAEELISKMIENKEALYLTPDESRKMRGY